MTGKLADRQGEKAEAADAKAVKTSKKHLRGGRRARKASIEANARRNQAATLHGRAAVLDANAMPDPTRPIGVEPVEPARAAPAQWAPDPWGQHRLRWWDGAQWTGETAD